jgi:hypothetical protein
LADNIPARHGRDYAPLQNIILTAFFRGQAIGNAA